MTRAQLILARFDMADRNVVIERRQRSHEYRRCVPLHEHQIDAGNPLRS